MQRFLTLSSQIYQNNTSQENKLKQEWFKEDGWGYKDTNFKLLDDGTVALSGNRYSLSGQKLEKFVPWVEEVLGIDLNQKTLSKNEQLLDAPFINQAFLDEIKPSMNEINLSNRDRLMHSHGHSMQEIYELRYGKLEKTVDCVVYIGQHSEAEILVKAAVKHNVVLMPYGGGTNVTQALVCPVNEKRMIVSVDVTRMNQIKWVDKKNMMACVQAGIIGQDLEKELATFGVCSGHEPDSMEFSTLGGWISTRASGMKKNRYGNIDDLILNITLVTTEGTFQKTQNSPRLSSGPDLNHLVMGSEGLFGIITEAVIKVTCLPEKKVFDSIIFPNFEKGYKFMRETAAQKHWPASLRLIDNTQFVFGMALKTEVHSKHQQLLDDIKKFYVTQIKGFDPMKMTVATILYEGRSSEVNQQQQAVNAIAKQNGGLQAGEENGKRGYFLTFSIAYLRDFGLNYGFIAESFETSCNWDRVLPLCENVTNAIKAECTKHGVKKKPFISLRVTQIYQTGAAVYVYFGFIYLGIKGDPMQVYSEIEDKAREVVMQSGGSISHHHGVGKLRKQFMKNSIGQTGKNMISNIKQSIDPKNIFANGNLI